MKRIEVRDGFRTRLRGTLADEYEIYRACASDGNDGDNTRGGAPLLSFDEWLGNRGKLGGVE